MKAGVIGIAIIFVAGSVVPPVLGQPEAQKPPLKAGNIIITGNDVTQDRVIRRAINIYPGQELRYADLRRAEKSLVKLGIFNNDSGKGIRPTLTVVESEGEFKDILVQVQEQPTGRLIIAGGINSDGVVVLRLVLEETNFDPRRWPTCMADILEGRAFRGAGRKIRLSWQVPVIRTSP